MPFLSSFVVVQGDQKVSVHLMITIQKVTSNVWSVRRQSPDIYWHPELCSQRACSVYHSPHSKCILWWPSSDHQLCGNCSNTVIVRCTETFWSPCIMQDMWNKLTVNVWLLDDRWAAVWNRWIDLQRHLVLSQLSTASTDLHWIPARDRARNWKGYKEWIFRRHRVRLACNWCVKFDKLIVI